MEDGLHDFPGGCPLSDHRSHRVQSIGAASWDFTEDHHCDPEADIHFPALLCQFDRAGRTHPGNNDTEGLLPCFLSREKSNSRRRLLIAQWCTRGGPIPLSLERWLHSALAVPFLHVFPLFLLLSFLLLLLYFSLLVLLVLCCSFSPTVSLVSLPLPCRNCQWAPGDVGLPCRRPWWLDDHCRPRNIAVANEWKTQGRRVL